LKEIVAAVLLVAAAGSAMAQSAEPVRRSYIVQLVDKPAASYTGQVPGLAATKPPAGQRLIVDAVNVQNYVSYLEQKKSAVLSAIPTEQVTHSYNIVFNGFAAMLTDDEARALKKNSAVAKISANTLMHTSTSYTPTFLGLNKPGGLWDQVGGMGAAGENMIIGMLDTGIWPENPSFADRVDENGAPVFSGGTLAYDAPPASWKGSCGAGQGFSPANCNNKLIGASIFPPFPYPLSPYEYISARDSQGHGTHTASTAAGDAKTAANVGGIAMGNISGMAPRARLAIYKVCWTADYGGGYQNSCPTAGTVAAVEQAVKDGVNVISFSIGDSNGGGTFDDPTELAFLGAANAGVFVAAAAGNEGPQGGDPRPVTHISPWLTTVANSTHNRIYMGNVTLGSGDKLSGATTNANTPSAPLLLAKDAGKLGTSPSDIRIAQCYGPEDKVGMPFDVSKVKGKILVCDRGGNFLVNKVKNAISAGAVGVVITNIEGGATSLPAQGYDISTVHLALAEAKKLKSYIAAAPSAGVAALGDVHATFDANPAAAPVIAGSSSRGPNVADANILKPDLAAPGTDILAGGLPYMPTEADFEAPYTGGKLAPPAWEFMTGTSMATPHVSGMAAVLKQLHPDWSPAAIKSALMTTAFDTQSDGLSSALPWDGSARDTGKLPWGQGAGQVAPSTAADPGLVYDLGQDDYRRFLCGQSLRINLDCSGVAPLAGYDLNLASLTAESVLSTQTLHRTVTNVGAANATYTVSASVPGFQVEVKPTTLTLAPGAKGDYTVKLTRTDATMHEWRYGTLVWSDASGHKVRSPLIARSAPLATLNEVYSEATTGSKLVTLAAGYTGAVSAVKSALVPATQTAGTVAQSDGNPNCLFGDPGAKVTRVTIPSGTLVARWALYNADTSGGMDSDLDLGVLDGSGNLVASSGSAGSDESVTLVQPAPGDYFVCVVGFAPAGGSADYKLSSWVIGKSTPGASMKAAVPAIVYQGMPAVTGLSWAGLDSGKRYLGALNYLYGGAPDITTLLQIDTTDPLPSFRSARATAAPVK
jgi:subtilisin family serine protease